MDKRNSYLDVAKFLFSIIVILFHCGYFFHGGYIVVEAFFMISGYFMMCSLARDKGELSLGVATAKFVAHKYKSIAFYLIPSALIGCAVYAYIIPGRDLLTTLIESSLIVFEVIPLQVSGFQGYYTTGVSWYLSALFLTMLMIYPLARKFRENFTLTFSPLISILTYGYLASRCGHLEVPNNIVDLFNTGLLRGIAGICAGCFLYECSTRLGNREISISGKVLFTILEIAGWAFCVFCIHKYPKSEHDFTTVIIMFGLLIIGINRYSLLSYLIQFRWTKYLANISMVIYLNHYYWHIFLNAWRPNITLNEKLPIYFALITVSSAFVYFVGRFSMRLWDKRMSKKVSA